MSCSRGGQTSSTPLFLSSLHFSATPSHFLCPQPMYLLNTFEKQDWKRLHWKLMSSTGTVKAWVQHWYEDISMFMNTIISSAQFQFLDFAKSAAKFTFFDSYGHSLLTYLKVKRSLDGAGKSSWLLLVGKALSATLTEAIFLWVCRKRSIIVNARNPALLSKYFLKSNQSDLVFKLISACRLLGSGETPTHRCVWAPFRKIAAMT